MINRNFRGPQGAPRASLSPLDRVTPRKIGKTIRNFALAAAAIAGLTWAGIETGLIPTEPIENLIGITKKSALDASTPQATSTSTITSS